MVETIFPPSGKGRTRPKWAAGNASDRSCPQSNHDIRVNDFAFEIEPPMATIDLERIGPLVQAPFAAWLEFEMLYCVGDEDRLAVDARVSQGLCQNATRGADERSTLLVFLVAGLLAYHHKTGSRRTFPGHNLACVFIERTARARLFGGTQRLQRLYGRWLGHERLRRATASALCRFR